MKYQVEYTRSAVNSLKKLDKQTAGVILSYIEKRLIDCDDPRRHGKALAGGLSDKWCYRVGNYRILANISDERITITIVAIGHRSDINK